MTDNLKAMVALIKKLTIGQSIPVRGFSGEVRAFNDEGVFVEIKVPPEEFEGTAKEMVVRDKRVEELQREVHSLRNEIDKMLYDREYYEYRRRKDDQHRRDMQRHREDVYAGMNLMMSPRYTGIYGGGEFGIADPLPKKELWIDPLNYKAPSQKKGK